MEREQATSGRNMECQLDRSCKGYTTSRQSSRRSRSL